jgi:hypothetical protein
MRRKCLSVVWRLTFLSIYLFLRHGLQEILTQLIVSQFYSTYLLCYSHLALLTTKYGTKYVQMCILGFLNACISICKCLFVDVCFY